MVTELGLLHDKSCLTQYIYDVASGSLKGAAVQFDAVDLVVSPNTRISKPLYDLITKVSNGSIREFDPVTKTLRPWARPE